MWISSIGYDSVHGSDRFVFTTHLEGGVHIIPALVGLFAIPQILDMLRAPTKAQSSPRFTIIPYGKR